MNKILFYYHKLLINILLTKLLKNTENNCKYQIWLKQNKTNKKGIKIKDNSFLYFTLLLSLIKINNRVQ